MYLACTTQPLHLLITLHSSHIPTHIHTIVHRTPYTVLLGLGSFLCILRSTCGLLWFLWGFTWVHLDLFGGSAFVHLGAAWGCLQLPHSSRFPVSPFPRFLVLVVPACRDLSCCARTGSLISTKQINAKENETLSFSQRRPKRDDTHVVSAAHPVSDACMTFREETCRKKEGNRNVTTESDE